MKTSKTVILVAFILNLLALLSSLSPLKAFVSILSGFSKQQVVLALVSPVAQLIVTIAAFMLWLYFIKRDKENQPVKYAKSISWVFIALAPILFFTSYLVAASFVYNLAATPPSNTPSESNASDTSDGIRKITPQEVSNALGRIPFTNTTTQWQNYTSDIYPMSLDVPAGAMVTIPNSGTGQQFIKILGPMVKDTYWPWIEISYYPDAPFYNPPAGVSIDSWILHNKDYPVPHDERGKDVKIAGLTAVHLIDNPSEQAHGMEDFYVISKNKLYEIKFLNSTGQPSDWTVYNKFLASIKFQ